MARFFQLQQTVEAQMREQSEELYGRVNELLMDNFDNLLKSSLSSPSKKKVIPVIKREPKSSPSPKIKVKVEKTLEDTKLDDLIDWVKKNKIPQVSYPVKFTDTGTKWLKNILSSL